MITGIDLQGTSDFTLPDDKENPTVWKLGVIPSLIFMKLAEEVGTDQVTAAFKVLQTGLKGWDNFNIPFSTVKETFYGRELDVIPLEVVEQIPINAAMAISIEIMNRQSILEKERKN